MPLTQKGLLLAGIVDALSTLKEHRGSTTKSIINYIQANPLPDMKRRDITELAIHKAIKQACDNRILRHNSGRYCIDFEGMSCLANAARYSTDSRRRGTPFFNADLLDSVSTHAMRTSKCRRKRRRSRRRCKRRSRRRRRSHCRRRKSRRRRSCRRCKPGGHRPKRRWRSCRRRPRCGRKRRRSRRKRSRCRRRRKRSRCRRRKRSRCRRKRSRRRKSCRRRRREYSDAEENDSMDSLGSVVSLPTLDMVDDLTDSDVGASDSDSGGDRSPSPSDSRSHSPSPSDNVHHTSTRKSRSGELVDKMARSFLQKAIKK